MTRVSWLLIRTGEVLRLEGCIAIVLLAMALGGYYLAISPLQERVSQAEHAYPRERHSLMLRLQAENAKRERPAKEYASFLEFFASPDPLTSRLKVVCESANAAGLALSKADYQLSDRRDLPLRELRISLPISGSYPKIRQFVTTALDRLPATALDDISFQRKSAQETSIDAVVTLTFFLPAPTFVTASR